LDNEERGVKRDRLEGDGQSQIFILSEGGLGSAESAMTNGGRE
jgi:hypothetical protein